LAARVSGRVVKAERELIFIFMFMFMFMEGNCCRNVRCVELVPFCTFSTKLSRISLAEELRLSPGLWFDDDRDRRFLGGNLGEVDASAVEFCRRGGKGGGTSEDSDPVDAARDGSGWAEAEVLVAPSSDDDDTSAMGKSVDG